MRLPSVEPSCIFRVRVRVRVRVRIRFRVRVRSLYDACP